MCILVVDTPIKQKPKEVGNKLGKTLPFITVNLCSLFIGKSVSVESTWWSALQILTSKCQACESNRTGTGTGKGGYITTIHWMNYSTDTLLRVTLLLSDKWAVWLICYYSKDLCSPSIHQSWLPHLISLRSWKQEGVWTIHRFILFLFLVTKSSTLFMNVILCCWHFSWHLLTDVVVMFTNINHYFKWGLVNKLTWQSSANVDIYIYKGAFSSHLGPRNLWLCLACLVNNFDLPLWSRMYTPNWSLHHKMY